MSDAPPLDSAAVRLAARRTSWVATACLSGSLDDRDPLNGDALPRPLGALLRSVRDASATGRNPLPADGLQQLVEFVLQPLREVIERPRARIARSHAMMPLHRVRDLDAKCTEWVGRQPGRTVREKLAGKPSILGVRRDFSAETNENILVAKLLRGLLPRVDERLRMVAAGDFDVVDSNRHEALLACQRVCVRALRASVFGEIDHRKPVRPNNVLLGDRRYVKLWRGWRWLGELDAGERARVASASELFMQALFAKVCADAAARRDARFAEAVLLVPSASVDDSGRVGVSCLRHAGEGFMWSQWRTAEFLMGEGDPACFERVELDGSTIVLSRCAALGHAVLRAGPQSLRTECRVEFTTACAGDGAALGVRCLNGAEVLFSGPSDLHAIRVIAERVLRSHGVDLAATADPGAGGTEGLLQHGAAPAAVGIDLGSASIATDVGAAGAAQNFSRFAVGFHAAARDAGGAQLHWVGGRTETTPDVLRRGIDLVSLNDLLAESDRLATVVQSGAVCILGGLRSLLEQRGVSPSVRKAVIVPDSKSELAQSALRRLSLAALGRSVHVSRTASLAMGWLQQMQQPAKLNPEDVLVVIDARSDGLAVSFLQAKHDLGVADARPGSGGIHWERRPAFVASDLDPRLATLMRRASWRAVLVEYARRVIDLSPFDPQLECHQLQGIAEMLADAGHVEHVLTTGEATSVLLGNSDGWAIRIPHDSATARTVVAEFVQDLHVALEALFQDALVDRVRRGLGTDGTRWHILLADLPGLHGAAPLAGVLETTEIERLTGRLRAKLRLAGAIVVPCARSLAAAGAAEMLEREAAGVPSVVDWLPPLSLEVMEGGGYREFTLLEDAVTSPLRSSTVDSFEVNQRLMIPAGARAITFPLFEGRAMRQDREVALESDAFPLEAPLKVAMRVLYRHGEEQPYDLVVEPADSAIKHAIRATIGPPTPKASPVPSFPPARSWDDPWVEERVGWTISCAAKWDRCLDELTTCGSTLDPERFSVRFKPVLRDIYMNVRSIWGDGRLLETAPAATREALLDAVPFRWLERLSALDPEAKLKLEARVPDHNVRHKLRWWSRRILGAMHSERCAVLLPVVLSDFAAKPSKEHLENFGQLVGDGKGDRAVCLQHLADAVRATANGDRRRGVDRSAVLALGEACWRHTDFVHELHARDPELVDLYLGQAASIVEHHAAEAARDPDKAIQNLAPQCVRAVGETVLALLRLRELQRPPTAVRAGSPLLTRLGIAFCQAERELSELQSGASGKQRALRLNSYLRFEFKRDPRLSRTSDLAFVLRHYLNGGSAAMIEIVGRTDQDDAG